MKKEDILGLGIVLVLYILQGVPLGLTGCVPLVLQDRGKNWSLLVNVFKIILLLSILIMNVTFFKVF